MNKSRRRLLYNNIHFLFLLAIIAILALNNFWYTFLLLPYLIFLFYKTNLRIMSLIVLALIGISSLQYLKRDIPYEVKGIVVDMNDNSLKLLTKYGYIKLYTKDEFSLGDYLEVKTRDKTINLSPFDYDSFLLNQNIYAKRELVSAQKRNNYFVMAKFRAKVMNLCKSNNETVDNYLATFIFGVNLQDSDFKEATRQIGISHILAISGLHISILLGLLSMLLDKVFYLNRPKNVIKICFLIFYLFLTNFQLTIIRSALMIILANYFKQKNFAYTNLDVFSMVGLLLLTLHPRYLFLMSFELSFLSTFIIITFFSEFKRRNPFISSFLLTFTIFFASLPLMLKYNYEINLLTLLVSPLYSLLFEFILFPLTLIALIFPFIAPYLEYVFLLFEKSVYYLGDNRQFFLIFGSVNSFEIIIYFVLFFLFCASLLSRKGIKRRLMLIALFLFILYERPLFNPFYEVKFLDVGQGDAILISSPYDTDHYLVDAHNTAYNYLKFYGVKRLTAFFVTHGHSDHLGNYSSVIKIFKPKKLYTSYYDRTDSLAKAKANYPFGLLKKGMVLKKGNVSFKVLGPSFYSENENDNSLVMLLEIYDKSFLLAADMEKKEEESLLDNLHTITVYKVAHHGSNSSSTKELLDKIKPQYSVISVGANNSYHLPNNDLVLKLANLYRTDYDQTITFIVGKRLFKINKGTKRRIIMIK